MNFLSLKIYSNNSHEDWETDQQRCRKSLPVSPWTSPLWTLPQVLCAFFHQNQRSVYIYIIHPYAYIIRYIVAIIILSRLIFVRSINSKKNKTFLLPSKKQKEQSRDPERQDSQLLWRCHLPCRPVFVLDQTAESHQNRKEKKKFLGRKYHLRQLTGGGRIGQGWL